MAGRGTKTRASTDQQFQARAGYSQQSHVEERPCAGSEEQSTGRSFWSASSSEQPSRESSVKREEHGLEWSNSNSNENMAEGHAKTSKGRGRRAENLPDYVEKLPGTHTSATSGSFLHKFGISSPQDDYYDPGPGTPLNGITSPLGVPEVPSPDTRADYYDPGPGAPLILPQQEYNDFGEHGDHNAQVRVPSAGQVSSGSSHSNPPPDPCIFTTPTVPTGQGAGLVIAHVPIPMQPDASYDYNHGSYVTSDTYVPTPDPDAHSYDYSQGSYVNVTSDTYVPVPELDPRSYDYNHRSYIATDTYVPSGVDGLDKPAPTATYTPPTIPREAVSAEGAEYGYGQFWAKDGCPIAGSIGSLEAEPQGPAMAGTALLPCALPESYDAGQVGGDTGHYYLERGISSDVPKPVSHAPAVDSVARACSFDRFSRDDFDVDGSSVGSGPEDCRYGTVPAGAASAQYVAYPTAESPVTYPGEYPPAMSPDISPNSALRLNANAPSFRSQYEYAQHDMPTNSAQRRLVQSDSATGALMYPSPASYDLDDSFEMKDRMANPEAYECAKPPGLDPSSATALQLVEVVDMSRPPPGHPDFPTSSAISRPPGLDFQARPRSMSSQIPSMEPPPGLRPMNAGPPGLRFSHPKKVMKSNFEENAITSVVKEKPQDTEKDTSHGLKHGEKTNIDVTSTSRDVTPGPGEEKKPATVKPWGPTGSFKMPLSPLMKAAEDAAASCKRTRNAARSRDSVNDVRPTGAVPSGTSTEPVDRASDTGTGSYSVASKGKIAYTGPDVLSFFSKRDTTTPVLSYGSSVDANGSSRPGSVSSTSGRVDVPTPSTDMPRIDVVTPVSPPPHDLDPSPDLPALPLPRTHSVAEAGDHAPGTSAPREPHAPAVVITTPLNVPAGLDQGAYGIPRIPDPPTQPATDIQMFAYLAQLDAAAEYCTSLASSLRATGQRIRQQMFGTDGPQ